MISIQRKPNKICTVLAFFLVSSLFFGICVSAESNTNVLESTTNPFDLWNPDGQASPGNSLVQDNVMTGPDLSASSPASTIIPEITPTKTQPLRGSPMLPARQVNS
jgi:hypothetical protein